MGKNPTGVRFDKDKLKFVMEREKLTSPQQVVNFLLEAYWWQNKAPQPIVQTIIVQPTTTETRMNPFDAYQTEILATTYSGDLQKVMKSMEADIDLGAANKAKLRIVANEHRTTFIN